MNDLCNNIHVVQTIVESERKTGKATKRLHVKPRKWFIALFLKTQYKTLLHLYRSYKTKLFKKKTCNM